MKHTRVLLLLALVFFAAGCDDEGDYVKLFHTEPIAPSLTETQVSNLDFLGATLIDQGANFSVYSENATRVELLLFDEPESNTPTKTFEMTRYGDVWNVYVEGVGIGQHYGYVAWGPNWPYDENWIPGSTDGFIADVDAEGNRYNPNKLLFDPYSTKFHRDHDWLAGSLASGPHRDILTYKAASKSVIVVSDYQWSEHETSWRENRKNRDWEGHAANDLIVYEVHLKGFTMGDSDPAVNHKGTFRGMGEKAAYLQDLGITAVELMPIMEKPLDGTYWGYNTLLFFSPESSYASQTELNETLDEFKWMVDQLHQHDIEVILDVVYNHTGEGGFWRTKMESNDYSLPGDYTALANLDEKEVSSLYNFRGLDNASYYHTCRPEICGEGKNGEYFFDQTGVGNQCRTNHTPMRRLILDSLRFWVEEMHVDGYRFDLATILGVTDENPLNYDPANSVLQDIIDDPILKAHNTRIIAEPWALGQYHPGSFHTATEDPSFAWYEWNGTFRDVWRAFINEDERALNSNDNGVDLGGAMTGTSSKYSWNGRKPYHSVNFLTAHDGFTLYDLFSYNEKKNLCGALNPICCDQPANPFCDPNSGDDHNRSRDWGDEAFKRQLIRTAFVALFLSQGTPMMLGGDEWMRTQLGNNNAYSDSADNRYNWFDWGTWKADAARVRNHDFVRKLIQFRKDHSYAFAPTEYNDTGFAWKSPQNTDDVNWGGRSVMQHFYDTEKGPELVVLYNMNAGYDDTVFTLPENRTWVRILDTQMYFESDEYLTDKDTSLSHNITLDEPEAITDASYGVKPRSVVVLKAL